MNGNGPGRLTRDPERDSTAGGTPVCKMRIAFITRDRDKPAFLPVDAYGKQAEACLRYLRKGSLVHVDGDIETPQWESNGQPRSMVVVRARRVEFLSAPTNGGESQPQAAAEPGEPEQPADIPAADLGELASIAAEAKAAA